LEAGRGYNFLRESILRYFNHCRAKSRFPSLAGLLGLAAIRGCNLFAAKYFAKRWPFLLGSRA
jgi:hypothetical protein